MGRPPLPQGPYLVVGLGRAGLSAARALTSKLGADAVRVWDSSADADQRARAAVLRAEGVDVRLGGDGLDALVDVRTMVKSPGVPPEASVVAAALSRSVEVIDELEIGWRLVAAPTLAVTGTKGKSTVAALCVAVLDAHGLEPALCGNTEFGRPLGELALAPPPRSLVAEVSSYQLEYSSEMFADAAAFTNLSPEHLNRHRTMDAYGAAKRRLFVRGDRVAPIAVLNVDDPVGARFAVEVEERGGRAVRYGCSETADYRILACRWDLHGSQLEMDTPDGPVTLATRLPGLHNAANVAAALALAESVGLPRESTLAGLAAAEPVPGRFEVVEVDRPFDVVVDLCVSPAGVAAALDAVRPLAAARGGRVLAVLGVLGRLAAGVAAESAALARERCDHLILAATSYRGEPRIPALASLAAGARRARGGEFELVIDRREAIARSIEMARPGDVIAILGRGHIDREATDARGGYRDLDDRQVARELA